MSGAKAAKKKQSLWQTLRAASGPYRRLYAYVKPYKVRFIVGLLLGFAYGGVNSLLPLATARVTSAIFHGAAPNHGLALESWSLGYGTENQFDYSHLSGHSSDHDSAQPLLLRKYILHAVGKQQSGHGYRGQLFTKIMRHSMDFFNRMQAGFLMSRIANDTRNMQVALTTISGDIFKQPVTIIGTVTVLLLMDWKFTVVTLVLFPICILPMRIFGRRARKAVQGQKGTG